MCKEVIYDWNFDDNEISDNEELELKKVMINAKK
jgi:hypothetical protein